MDYINLVDETIADQHICCAFSDKKCRDSYNQKKTWLKEQFKNGYVFRRLDERAKVFIEYGPAEYFWGPVDAPNYLMLGCFWVSGKYKSNGHGKALLQYAIEDAKSQGKAGLATVVGKKKMHFMSDTKWLLKQGFEMTDETKDGFVLLALDFEAKASQSPVFTDDARQGGCPDKKGIVVYYSNRCPYSEYHVTTSLQETAHKRGLSLKAIKLESQQQAMACPSPATIFSLYLDGRFITTDISVCMDSRFDKILASVS